MRIRPGTKLPAMPPVHNTSQALVAPRWSGAPTFFAGAAFFAAGFFAAGLGAMSVEVPESMGAAAERGRK